MAAIVLFVVTFWSALGLPPLGGTTIEWVLAFILVSLVNLGLGTLGGGAVIEWRHPTWSRLGLWDHIFMGVALVVLLASDGGFAWWLFSSTSGAFSRWVFLIIALVALALGAWSVWHPLPFVFLAHPPGRPGRSGRATTTRPPTMSSGNPSRRCRSCWAPRSGSPSRSRTWGSRPGTRTPTSPPATRCPRR